MGGGLREKHVAHAASDLRNEPPSTSARRALQQAHLRVWGPRHLKNISRHLRSREDTWLCLGADRAVFLVGFGRSLVEPKEPGGENEKQSFQELSQLLSFLAASPSLSS